MPSNALPPIAYTDRDYNSIIASLQTYYQAQFGSSWTDFYQSNIGSILTEAVAYCADVINFAVDLAVNESYLGTAQDLQSMLQITAALGYQMSSATAASVTCSAAPNPVSSSVLLIPAGTSFTSVSGVSFQLLGGYTIPANSASITVTATAGSAASDTFTSDGTAFQVMALTKSGDIEGSVGVTVNGTEWTQVDSLAYGAFTTNCYTLTHNANQFGFINFGDGNLGAIPPNGATVVVSYRVGGGVSGNIPVGGIDTTVQAVVSGSDPAVYVNVTLTSTAAGTGGNAFETVDHARYWAPYYLRTNGRAVTLNDFITLATAYNDPVNGSPAYASAELHTLVPETNLIDVYLWSVDIHGNPVPAGPSLITAVQSYFDNNGPGAVRLISLDTDVQVGQVLTIDVSMNVFTTSSYSTTAIVNDVQQAIQALFVNPYALPGKPFRISGIYTAVQQVPGVLYSTITGFTGSLTTVDALAALTSNPQTVTGTLAGLPLPQTVVVTVSGTTDTATDNGSGVLSGNNISGTIDYSTGAYSITFTETIGAVPTVTYRVIAVQTWSEVDYTFSAPGTNVVAQVANPPVVPGTLTLYAGRNNSPGAVYQVVLNTGGSGYTSAPTVAFSGGGGSGATATATVTLTAPLASVTLDTAGTGYSGPTVAFSGGGGTGATATAQISGGVGSATVTAGGTGYTSAPTVAFSGGGGSGATATAVLTGTAVTSITITAAGTGYTSAPTITFSGGGGSGAAATAVLSAVVTGITLTSDGSGYNSAPTVTISDPTGTGATATAVLGTLTGPVTSLHMGPGGSDYTSAPTVVFSGGGGSGATATAYAAAPIIITDDGNGNLVSAGNLSSTLVPTIDYGTGSFKFSLNVSQVTGTQVASVYNSQLSNPGRDMPVQTSQMASPGLMNISVSVAS